MHSAEHYRRQAVRARQVAGLAHQPEIQEMLRTAAQDDEEIAQDIEWERLKSAHPELLPQPNH